MSSLDAPLAGNLALLTQGAALLERLDDAQYGTPRQGWAPVGAQYRHVVEHYIAFLDGLAAARIDYDARPRDEQIERSRHAALTATRECLAGLGALHGGAERAVEVQMDSGAGPESPDWRGSTAGRELQFLCSHTVHHYALIRLLLEGDGIELGREFGVAPSTLAHQRASAPSR